MLSVFWRPFGILCPNIFIIILTLSLMLIGMSLRNLFDFGSRRCQIFPSVIILFYERFVSYQKQVLSLGGGYLTREPFEKRELFIEAKFPYSPRQPTSIREREGWEEDRYIRGSVN